MASNTLHTSPPWDIWSAPRLCLACMGDDEACECDDGGALVVDAREAPWREAIEEGRKEGWPVIVNAPWGVSLHWATYRHAPFWPLWSYRLNHRMQP